ncbi:MAG: radical SAM protein, partial [Alphaproteobacteria bacterium]
YSFPMRYQPTDRPDRGHIGEHWNKYYLRSIQIILQATHGVVSGAPAFFKKAFGNTEDEFLKILRTPHKYIFNRDWYEKYNGRSELDEFNSEFRKLDESEINELMHFLSSNYPSEYVKESKKMLNKKISKIVPFYELLSEEESRKIWSSQKQIKNKLKIAMADDEIVEDAGLDHNPDSEIEENMRKVIAR